eukprot:CAMPEP_0178917886 /NCGR_PEP_ID=MMETSP0786-20121207/13512_1 /TAXON_ID=186022 /ORGANISM="Thalassionema frauenfeldii, Strain CCMP 1798" /LENGTH=365 /DNA_ID=CAMNT_0020591519 /DNA_START=65 /DNA_END=1162 /DNA_ORIENTATION=+
MDLLKRELERKKKAISVAKQKSSSKSRFLKASDLRRTQEEEEDRLRLKRTVSKTDDAKTDYSSTKNSNKSTTDKNNSEQEATDHVTKRIRSDSSSGQLTSGLSAADVLARLRSLGLPIKFFGETFNNQKIRLQTALEHETSQSKTQTEMDEFRLGKGHGIRNPFLDRKGEEDTKGEDAVTENSSSKKNEVVEGEEKAIKEEEDTKDDPHKRIYNYFKGLLREWEDDLMNRPETAKATVAGKNETKTLKQCKDYIRPLFKQCKTRKLQEGLLLHISKIVDYCKENEFVKAHDAYLDVAIGRAAWPIGVTMVGIHARSGRAKIEASNVAHVMNSELQRKYLTSVKRLMSYAQKKAQNVAPSKKVMNL